MARLELPRFVIDKPLASGKTGFYFNIHTHWRKLGCTIPNEPLGTDYADACGKDGNGGRAAALNALFDEWDATRKGMPIETDRIKIGTVDWLFREYRKSDAYIEKVSMRSRRDYENTMLLVADTLTKKGDRLGSRGVRTVTPRGVDKIYAKIIDGPNGKRLRQGEKAVALCRKAWKVVRRLYPTEFDPNVPNPWEGVTKKQRVKKKKPAVTREQVYAFAHGCIAAGKPEPAAAAIICFEWLQRPENVLAGYIRWPDYRSKDWPDAIRIEHHKTGELVWHPLQETVGDDTAMFYADAEAILAKLPKRGVPMILRNATKDEPAKPYSYSGMQKIVHTMRDRLKLPSTFTLDACRHGGMTELEVAELTDGQGRALSGHKTKQAYVGYAKQTLERALPATRKRHAHLLANKLATSLQNGQRNGLQNDDKKVAQAV
jgi:hypothetical protein